MMGQPADGYTIGTVTTSTVELWRVILRSQFKIGDFISSC